MKIPVGGPHLGEEEVENILKVVKEGWIARGKEHDLFEKELASYLGSKYAVLLSSGTDALEVAFRSLGIENKEIITTATSCSPTTNGVIRSGNKLVFVDADPLTYNIDTNKIEEVITEKTVAIMPVHIYGRPCQMDKIMEIAKKHNLEIIEDCAQSMGAKFKDKMTGTFGKIGCFSLNVNKIITTGEGGFIITDDKEVADKAKVLRNYGRSIERTDYCYTMFGSNFKMTNLQAAIGLAQIKKIDYLIKKRRENGVCLLGLLKDINKIQLPFENEDEFSVYFAFPILLKTKGVRDKLKQYIEERGIESRTMYRPMCNQPYYEKMYG